MVTRSGRKVYGMLLNHDKDDLLLSIAWEIENIYAKVASLETWRERTKINQEMRADENEDN